MTTLIQPAGFSVPALQPPPVGGRSYIDFIRRVAGIQHYWPLNEVPGSTTWYDRVGNVNMIANVGTPRASRVGLTQDPLAGSVVAAVGNMSLKTASGFAVTSPLSFEMWVYFYAPLVAGSGLGKWDSNGILFFFNSFTDIEFYAGPSGVAWTTATSDQFFGVHHYVGTHDGTTSRLFTDGVQRVSAAKTFVDSGGGQSLYISGYNGGSSICAGIFSDIAIYNRAMPADEILYHYKRGLGTV